MKFTIEHLDPDEAEVAFLRRADLRRADMSDLTLEMLWSRVGLAHDGFTFDGYGFAIGYIANLVDVAENLPALGDIEVVLDESADRLQFSLVHGRLRISADGDEVQVEFATFVKALREFALGAMNGIMKSHPGLEENRELMSLVRRIRALRPAAG